MKTAILHPRIVENSLPLELQPSDLSGEMQYQILTRGGKLLRKGAFQCTLLNISTCMLPRGEEFLIRILSKGQLMHESAFQTLGL